MLTDLIAATVTLYILVRRLTTTIKLLLIQVRLLEVMFRFLLMTGGLRTTVYLRTLHATTAAGRSGSRAARPAAGRLLGAPRRPGGGS